MERKVETTRRDDHSLKLVERPDGVGKPLTAIASPACPG